MGKYKLNESTLEDIRAARVRYLIPGPEAKAPVNWEKLLENQAAVGPWKWWERVRIASVDFIEHAETSKEGTNVDRIDIKFEIDGNSPTNADRSHVEFIRLDETTFDATQGGAVHSKRNKFSFGTLDQIITAVRGKNNYVLDDDGDGDPILTLQQCVGSEVMAKCDLRTKKNRETSEWSVNFSFAEFAAIE